MPRVQYLWIACQILALASMITMLTLTLLRRPTNLYIPAVACEAGAFGLSLYTQISAGGPVRLLENENAIYISYLAALLALGSSFDPALLTLYPFFLYSAHHAVSWFERDLLDTLPLSLQTQAAVSEVILRWLPSARTLVVAVATCELALPLLVLDEGWRSFSALASPRGTLWNVVAVCVFLMWKYSKSPATKEAVRVLMGRLGRNEGAKGRGIPRRDLKGPQRGL